MTNRMVASLSRRGSRYPIHEPGFEPRLAIVVRNSAEDALLGRAERLRKADVTLTEESALARVYGNPANRRLVLAAVYG